MYNYKVFILRAVNFMPKANFRSGFKIAFSKSFHTISFKEKSFIFFQ